ncbi:unnamed protein product [Cuscuta epithymum]|uniref:Ribosomal protein L34Ae n=1 Tax=Cuscuta epithymum TaxID=186058 RepID=A0AAV0E6W4_9ASTE|nr:unnamed protein product [Cuscuta epithymum]
MDAVYRVWVTVSSYLQPLLVLVASFLSRLRKGVSYSSEKSLGFSETPTESVLLGGYETETDSVRISEEEINDEKENTDYGFTFRFPTYQEFINGKKETGVDSKNQEFDKGSTGPITEQLDIDSKGVCLDGDEDTVSLNRVLEENHFQGETVSNKSKVEIYDSGVWKEEKTEEFVKPEDQSCSDDLDFSSEILIQFEEKKSLNRVLDENQFQAESVSNKSKVDIFYSGVWKEEKTEEFVKPEDQLCSDDLDFSSEILIQFREKISINRVLDENQFQGETVSNKSKVEIADSGVWIEEKTEEFVNTEDQLCSDDLDFSSEILIQPEEKKSIEEKSCCTDDADEKDLHNEGSFFWSDEDFGGDIELDDSALLEEDAFKGVKQGNSGILNLESGFLSENDFEEDEESELESWEHEDLLEQLKMELKKMRGTRLPTIYEDSASPKMDELKPWKINDRIQREESILDELMKFYKIYKERMRKFDIFTNQKLFTLGFLQKEPLKDPFQLLSTHKYSTPPPLLKSIWPFKQKNSNIDDPVLKFVKDLQCELEVVYVGQMCLSWEFLHWQYGKIIDLWETDLSGSHQYNEAAEEFQQFQVLLQRYIEDERFHGRRVQCYIKSRCDFRNFLQVPVIREDNLKEMKKGGKFEKGDFVITSDDLVEIVEECIRIFWRFVKADSSIVHGKCHPEIENAEDHDLLMEVRRNLQKKERKLKDCMKSEKCILKRFRTCRDDKDDDDSDHVLCFFSQVDMKLVSRVLNMCRLTREQLVWCYNKLNRISFVNRKIQVESSFLLFPC